LRHALSLKRFGPGSAFAIPFHHRCWWRQKAANQIPVPGVSTDTGARVLERFELKPFCR